MIRRWREEQALNGDFEPSKRDERNNEMLEPILDGKTVKQEAEKKKSKKK